MTLEETGFLICDILSFKDDSESFLSRLRNFTEADWNTLLTFSSRYKLAPLLYSKLLKYKNELPLPSAMADLLRGEYMNSAARYAILHHEIKNLLMILGGNKIDVILLKGAYIAEKFYKKPALRPMCDIDILVKKEDTDRIFELLEGNGYKIKSIEDADSKRQLHCPGITTKTDILIEPHWDISPSLIFSWKKSVDTDKLWRSVVVEKLFGLEIVALPLEYLIVHLCVKIVIDNFRGQLLQLYDIALILQQSNLDWNSLFSIAKEWTSEKDVFCILYLSKILFRANVPDEVLARFRPNNFGYPQISFMQKELFDVSSLTDDRLSRVLQRTTGQNLFRQALKILNGENISLFGGEKRISIRKIRLVFNRLKYLIKQYKGVLSFRVIRNGRTTFDFYRWLKRN